MKFSTKVCLIVLAAYAAAILAQAAETVDPRVRAYVDPVRVVWKTEGAAGYVGRCKVRNEAALLAPKFGQVRERDACQLESAGNAAAIVLDFGRELHGGLQIEVNRGTRCSKVRVRFGESVAETFSDALSGERGAGNDHAMRDFEIMLPVCGSLEVGNTGFRFVRLDLLTSGSLDLGAVRAVSLMRPMKRLGSFRCSDERLNRVFETAVRTVHLCCQEYLWDGIKRDRLVWMGDTHPETRSILTVFGAASVLPESLDYAAETTPAADAVMNTMPNYTLWWIRNVHDWWFYTGDRAYLAKHRDYLKTVLPRILKTVKPDGTQTWGGFLDWPTQHNAEACKEGTCGLLATTLGDAAEMLRVTGDTDLAAQCDAAVKLLKGRKPDPCGSKQAAALLALGGLREPKEMFAEVLGKGGVAGVSTFYGYYMLEAMSAAGEDQRALDTVRDYWGAMLDVGATSFWENFDLAWTNNCFRIDEMPSAATSGKKDIHGDYGEFCYPGFRHSLCHGWAGGPAAWCIHHVLGIRPLGVGCCKVEVRPFLGDLAWAEGAMALPDGRAVRVRAEKKPDGSLSVKVDAPADIEVVK